MRGTVAKRLRAFAKADTPDLPKNVVYTTIVTGQDFKKMKGIRPNWTTRLDECQRQYYQILKRIWKAAS